MRMGLRLYSDSQGSRAVIFVTSFHLEVLFFFKGEGVSPVCYAGA